MSALTALDPLSCPFLNLGNRCQLSCSTTPSPNIFFRFAIGFVIKDTVRVYEIAMHVIIGLGKLMISTIKATYSIPAKLWSSTANYQKIGKEGFVHLGLSGFYCIDIFISLRNITNNYPQALVKKIERCFSKYIAAPSNPVTESHKKIYEEVYCKELKKHIKNTTKEEARTQAELHAKKFMEIFSAEYAKYAKKYTPEIAERKTKKYAKNHITFFDAIYLEYIDKHKNKKDVAQKAHIYAKDCIKVLSELLPRYPSAYAIAFAKIYVQKFPFVFAKYQKTLPIEEAEKKASTYTKIYTQKYLICLQEKIPVLEISTIASTYAAESVKKLPKETGLTQAI